MVASSLESKFDKSLRYTPTKKQLTQREARRRFAQMLAQLRFIQDKSNKAPRKMALRRAYRNIRALQRNYPDQCYGTHSDAGCAPLYEAIISMASTTQEYRIEDLTVLGLKLAKHEGRASSQSYVDWCVQALRDHVIDHAPRFALGQFDRDNMDPGRLGQARSALRAIGEVMKAHPELMTPAYVEMCSEYIALPLQEVPPLWFNREDRYADQKRWRERTQRDNDIIESLHDCAVKNLAHVLTLCQQNKTKIRVVELFSEISGDLLRKARAQQPQGSKRGPIKLMPDSIARLMIPYVP